MLKGFRRGCCVVAHPDDESMWFAGLLLSTPELDWTVVACSIPRRDPERALRFYTACSELGARAVVLPFVELDAERLAGLEHLDFAGYDLLATHNDAGEYGNPHHVLVYRAVLAASYRHAFGLLLSGYGLASIPPGRELVVEGFDYERKLAAIRSYDHTTAIDGRPKSEALLARYGEKFNLRRETYHALRW